MPFEQLRSLVIEVLDRSLADGTDLHSQAKSAHWNLKGPHFLTQQAARWMTETGEGRIAFVTSISAYTASVNRGGVMEDAR